MAQKENRFDQDAMQWDEKPHTLQIAGLSSAAILEHVPFTKSMDTLDFGCGTGLISEAILPHVNSVHGVDASQGMVDVFNKKIVAKKLQNASCQFVFLTTPDESQLDGRKFDVIFSSFAFHHVADISQMVSILASYLNPGGYLVVVDLDKTERTPLFHPKARHHDVFHHGFTSAELEQSANNPRNQFQSIKVLPAYTILFPVEDLDRKLMEFDAWILVCQKK